MKSIIRSLSKSNDFKQLILGKKKVNKYSTICFKKLSNKDNRKFNISFVVKKKLEMQ